MAGEESNLARIRRLNRAGLRGLWKQIAAGKTPGWAPGKAFEYLVLRAFETEGAKVRYPFSVTLPNGINEQIDGAIHIKGISAIVESKDQGKINVEPIAKLRNQLLRRPSAAVAVLFSRGGFSKPARSLSQYLAPQAILLWEGPEVEYILTKRMMMSDGLVAKYEKAVEEGLPDFNLRIEE